MNSRIPVLALLLFLLSCGDGEVFTPKPRAFPKIEYPDRSYQKFDANYCQFTFLYPSYATVEQDTSFFDEKPADPCWFNMVMPVFNAKVYCSYYPIEGNFEKLQNDAFNLASKHNIKADYIDELPIEKPNGVKGYVFDIEGAVASSFQFYLTDEEKHFLRGSLYFNTQARPDSLAPVLNFVKEDLMQMINTFEWTK